MRKLNRKLCTLFLVKVQKIVCALPRPPSNGRIRTEPQGEREFKDGEYIYYECNNNYRLVGERRVRCNGRKWSSAPTCQRKETFSFVVRSASESLLSILNTD